MKRAQRIRAAIEDEIVAKFAYGRLDLRVRRDFFCMDERKIEAGLHAMVEKNRIQCGARRGFQSE